MSALKADNYSGILKGTRFTVNVHKIEAGAVMLVIQVGSNEGALFEWTSGPLAPGESCSLGPIKIEMPYSLTVD